MSSGDGVWVLGPAGQGERPGATDRGRSRAQGEGGAAGQGPTLGTPGPTWCSAGGDLGESGGFSCSLAASRVGLVRVAGHSQDVSRLWEGVGAGWPLRGDGPAAPGPSPPRASIWAHGAPRSALPPPRRGLARPPPLLVARGSRQVRDPHPGFRPPRSEGRPHGWRRLRAEVKLASGARLPRARGRGPTAP